MTWQWFTIPGSYDYVLIGGGIIDFAVVYMSFCRNFFLNVPFIDEVWKFIFI